MNGYESVNRNNKRIDAQNIKGIKDLSQIKNSFSNIRVNIK